jgi:hypothetical protein
MYPIGFCQETQYPYDSGEYSDSPPKLTNNFLTRSLLVNRIVLKLLLPSGSFRFAFEI